MQQGASEASLLLIYKYNYLKILPLTSYLLCLISGVFLSLNGVTISNDSNVNFNDIGSGILCNTDKMNCCRIADHSNGVAQGHWYDPEGNEVGSFTDEYTDNPSGNFFARNRRTGAVRLYRFHFPTKRGRFRCEVPSASGINETLYVNIVNPIPIPPPISGEKPA